MILDFTYTLVDLVRSGNDQPELDMHEFKLTDDGTSVLVTIYVQIPYNPEAYGISGVRWITTGVFQEIDIGSGEVLFQWSSIDHVPVNMSYVAPGSTDISGDGLTNNTAWDYL
jgi:hypothetical protein